MTHLAVSASFVSGKTSYLWFLRLLFSRSVMSNCLRPHGLQHTRLPFLHQLLEFAQAHDHWVGDAIQPSCPCCPLLLLPSVFPSIRLFTSDGQSIRVFSRRGCLFSACHSPGCPDKGWISFIYSQIFFYQVYFAGFLLNNFEKLSNVIHVYDWKLKDTEKPRKDFPLGSLRYSDNIILVVILTRFSWSGN